MIKINYDLANIINNELGLIKNNNKYTLDEISKVTSLNLKNLKSLDDIEKLFNLKELSISSVKYVDLPYYINLESSTVVSHIKDFSNLEGLHQLEKLSIVNDLNIESLDLSELTNLKSLKLINNSKLTELYNLENLSFLEEVIIIGNNIKTPIDVEKYIVNTFGIEPNILDLNMYCNLTKCDPSKSKFLVNAYKLNFTKLKFAEQVNNKEFIYLSLPQANDMFNIANNLIIKNQLMLRDDYGKIKFLNEYIGKNIDVIDQKINSDNLTKLLLYSRELDGFKNESYMMSSSYNAVCFNKSNIEGTVNFMNYMLNLLEVSNQKIEVINNKQSKKVNQLYNHNILKVKLNGEWLYWEPRIDIREYNKKLLVDYNEVKEHNVLNTFELENSREVLGHEKHIKRNNSNKTK